MKLTPVKKYHKVTYPDKSTFFKNPDLHKVMPERWRGNIYAGLACSYLMLMSFVSCGSRDSADRPASNISEMSGCSPDTSPLPNNSATFSNTESTPGNHGSDNTTPANLIMVKTPVLPELSIKPSPRLSLKPSPKLPRTTLSGAVQRSTNFVSEEDAMRYIRFELLKVGIKLDDDAKVLENINIPETKYFSNTLIPHQQPVANCLAVTEPAPLNLMDGIQRKR